MLKNEKGATLIMVMFLITVISIVVIVLLNSYQDEFFFNIREENRIKAYYIAKSGADIISAAIEASEVDPSELNGKESSPVDLGDGKFSVKTYHTGKTTTVISTGIVKNISQTVFLQIVDGGFNIPNRAVHADEGIDMENGVVDGEIGVNSSKKGAIDLSGNPDIDGDIFVGPEADTEEAVYAPGNWWWNNYGGSVKNLPKEEKYNLPEFPSFPYPPLKGDISLSANDKSSISSNGRYDKIEVLENSKLIIDVNDTDRIIQVKQLSISGNSQILVNQNGSGKLIFYVENKLEMGGSTSINYWLDQYGNIKDTNHNHANNLEVYYDGGEKIDIAGTQTINGSLYANRADIILEGSGSVAGNVLSGKNITIEGGANTTGRVVMAPNGDITLRGGAQVAGSVIGNIVKLQGGARVYYKDELDVDIPGDYDDAFNKTWYNYNPLTP